VTTFPDDLSGHFWTVLERREDLDRFVFSIVDYQNNILLKGVASSHEQAAEIVHAWDQIIASGRSDDPSLGSAPGGSGLVDGWADLPRD
jgi:hypothetical protein